jgi:hypothetical protein
MRRVEALNDIKQFTSIWRGQPRGSDGLRASFFRDKTEPIPYDQLRKVDRDVEMLLSIFKAAQRYILTPFVGGEDRWSAIARHAGLASPLLDWTFSPYVAAFFAFRNRTEESDRCAVFRLNWRLVIITSERLMKKNPDGPYDDCLVLIAPKGLDNPPMHAQNGVFTRLYPPQVDIVEWVVAHGAGQSQIVPVVPDYDCMLTKYTVPRSSRDRALDSLHRMNIHAASLFPDLHGSAEYANDARMSFIRQDFLRLQYGERTPHV